MLRYSWISPEPIAQRNSHHIVEHIHRITLKSAFNSQEKRKTICVRFVGWENSWWKLCEIFSIIITTACLIHNLYTSHSIEDLYFCTTSSFLGSSQKICLFGCYKMWNCAANSNTCCTDKCTIYVSLSLPLAWPLFLSLLLCLQLAWPYCMATCRQQQRPGLHYKSRALCNSNEPPTTLYTTLYTTLWYNSLVSCVCVLNFA